jgi:serine protease Do
MPSSSSSVLQELAGAAGRVEGAAAAATVLIGRGGGRGSGVVVADGTVVTSAHNLRGPQVTVTFGGGRSERGDVRAADSEGDLAVVSVPTGDATPVVYGDPAADAALGAPVWALARTPAAGVRITFGTVSAVGQAFRGPRSRLVTGAVEHTAPLARGSSGGPLVDAQGRLLAVNTHRLGDGLYLAVPADAAFRQRLEGLAAGRAPVHRHLGIAMAPGPAARRMRAAVGLPERDGVLVRAVEGGSPAEEAGVRQGDLIVGAGGAPVRGADDLFGALDAAGEAAVLRLDIVRGVEETTLEVRFPS